MTLDQDRRAPDGLMEALAPGRWPTRLSAVRRPHLRWVNRPASAAVRPSTVETMPDLQVGRDNLGSAQIVSRRPPSSTLRKLLQSIIWAGESGS